MNTFEKQTVPTLHTDSTGGKQVLLTEVKILPNDNKRRFVALSQQPNSSNHGFQVIKLFNNEFQPSHVNTDDSLKWTTWYADDIYKHWKAVECSRPLFDLSSECFTWRLKQVLALKCLVKKYCFTNSTFHLAVHILDTFLSQNPIQKEKSKLLVIVCFLVAAKFEEDERTIPTLAQLNKLLWKDKIERFYKLEEYQVYELNILCCTRFKLTIPTVATFANFYSKATVNMEDYVAYNKQAATLAARPYSSLAGLFDSLGHMLSTVNSLLFQLADMSCEIVFLRNTTPSRMAAACVYAARRLNNVNPYWPIYLETLTQYNVIDLMPIAKPIIEVYTELIL